MQESLSSRNPDIDDLGKNKARLILLNKSDLSDERKNEAWASYFKAKGFYVVKLDARRRNSMKEIQNVILEACKEKLSATAAEESKPPGSCHGCGNPERGKIYIYQYLCRKSNVQRPEINQV